MTAITAVTLADTAMDAGALPAGLHQSMRSQVAQKRSRSFWASGRFFH